uniref:Putative ovule protein n=1 Tax=Solanum chacoense TaxID=4108 RepID=A0A0V0HLB6_SOLCH
MDDFCCTGNFMVFVLFLALLLHNSSEAFGTFRFDIHHMYSDPVKGILDLPWLPKKVVFNIIQLGHNVIAISTGTGLPAPLILLPTVAVLPAPLILLHYRSRSPEEETKQSYSVRWDCRFLLLLYISTSITYVSKELWNFCL